jgi:hypothetical protein
MASRPRFGSAARGGSGFDARQEGVESEPAHSQKSTQPEPSQQLVSFVAVHPEGQQSSFVPEQL